MSDIFREVDEDLRRDRFGKLWKRFAPYIIGVAVLIVAGTAGYRGWETWQTQRSQTAGDTLLSAIDAGNAGNPDVAAEELAKLDDAVGGYPLLARMRAASDLAAQGDKEAAIAAFDAIADDASIEQPFRNVAAIRAGYLALDTQDRAEVVRRIEPLSDAANTMRAAAWEILGLAAWKAGDVEAAAEWFDKIVSDNTAPADVSGRARMMQALVDSATVDSPDDAAAEPAASQGEVK